MATEVSRLKIKAPKVYMSWLMLQYSTSIPIVGTKLENLEDAFPYSPITKFAVHLLLKIHCK